MVMRRRAASTKLPLDDALTEQLDQSIVAALRSLKAMAHNLGIVAETVGFMS
jgi:hypothetical protein